MICNILVSKNQDCPACTVRLFKGRSRRLNLSHLCFIITTNVFRNIHSYAHVLSDPSLWSLSFAPLLQYLSVDASMTASFSNSRGNAKVICNSQVQGWWVTALSTAYCERKFHNVACASVAQRVSSNHRAVSWVRACLPRHYVIKANAKKTIFNFSISRWFKTNFKTGRTVQKAEMNIEPKFRSQNVRQSCVQVSVYPLSHFHTHRTHGKVL